MDEEDEDLWNDCEDEDDNDEKEEDEILAQVFTNNPPKAQA